MTPSSATSQRHPQPQRRAANRAPSRPRSQARPPLRGALESVGPSRFSTFKNMRREICSVQDLLPWIDEYRCPCLRRTRNDRFPVNIEGWQDPRLRIPLPREGSKDDRCDIIDHNLRFSDDLSLR